MTHKFDPKNLSRLDDPERKKTLPPEEILNGLGLKTGEAFLDIGAGTGYFTFPASDIVGGNGSVISADISEEMTVELSKRVSASGRKNIRVVLSGECSFEVPARSVDLAFMSNVLHEADDKPRMLAAIKEVLKENGRIGIVEWNGIPGPHGPPLSERIRKEELNDLLVEAGFNEIRISDIKGVYDLFSAKK